MAIDKDSRLDPIFDDHVEEGATSAEELKAQRRENVSGLMKNPNTRPKVLMTAIVLGTVIVGSLLFLNRGPSKEDLGESASIAAPRNFKQEPVTMAGKNVTPEYARLEKENNDAKAQQAIQTGGSHLALPTAEPVKIEKAPEVPVYVQAPNPNVNYANTGSNSLADAYKQKMLDQYGKISGNWAPSGHENFTPQGGNPQPGTQAYGTTPAGVAPVVMPEAGFQQVAASSAAAPAPNGQAPAGEVVIRAGKSYYGVTELEANSDSPGPVIVTMLAGPYKGAKLIGDFSVSRESITVKMNSLTPPTGDTIKINALLVDPNRASKDMATEVDKHYFQRYGLLLSAAFVSGLGQAAIRANSVVSTSPLGSTTTYGQLNTDQQLLVAAGSAGQALSTELNRSAQIPNTIKLKAGTPVAVTFLEDVRQ